jgi:hypothetical protein
VERVLVTVGWGVLAAVVAVVVCVGVVVPVSVCATEDGVFE